MKEFQITCVTKPNRMSPHEHITHIGNTANDWKLPREVAMRRIDAKEETYYTIDRTTGRKMYVGVVHDTNTRRALYLRTHADGKWNDNLLALDECTSNCKILT